MIKTAEYFTETERYDLLDKSKDIGITLNGKPASLAGVKLEFPHIIDKATGLSCEFSWAAVERILNKGGKFKS